MEDDVGNGIQRGKYDVKAIQKYIKGDRIEDGKGRKEKRRDKGVGGRVGCI